MKRLQLVELMIIVQAILWIVPVQASPITSYSSSIPVSLTVEQYVGATIYDSQYNATNQMVLTPSITWQNSTPQSQNVHGAIGLSFETNFDNSYVYCPQSATLTGPGNYPKIVYLNLEASSPTWPPLVGDTVMIGEQTYWRLHFPTLGSYNVSIVASSEGEHGHATSWSLDDQAGDYTGSFTLIIGVKLPGDTL